MEMLHNLLRIIVLVEGSLFIGTAFKIGWIYFLSWLRARDKMPAHVWTISLATITFVGYITGDQITRLYDEPTSWRLWIALPSITLGLFALRQLQALSDDNYRRWKSQRDWWRDRKKGYDEEA